VDFRSSGAARTDAERPHAIKGGRLTQGAIRRKADG
jgi:hypothetical protein